MIPFLSGFLRNLPSIQTKQLFHALSQRRDRGEIRSQENLLQELSALARLLKGNDLSRQTPPLAFLEGDLMESDAIRTFFTAARMDMEAMLGEAESLSNALRAHHRLITENYLDSIEAALDEIETEVRAYEVLNARKFSGFSRVFASLNFAGGVGSASAISDDPFVRPLTVDTRGSEPLLLSPPRAGDIGLHLGFAAGKPDKVHRFDSISIATDSSTPQTVLSVSTGSNVPNNAIDGDFETAWRHQVLLTDHPSSCRLKLTLSFVGAQRINALSITPLADVPMKIYEISYTDAGEELHSTKLGERFIATATGTASGTTRSALLGGTGKVPNSTWIIPNRQTVIPLGDIVARKIFLTLQQDSAGDGEFFYYDSEIGDWQSRPTLEAFFCGYSEEGGDAEVARQLGFIGTDKEGVRHARFVEYSFGLKDVHCLEREYGPNGLFIPEPIVREAPLSLALFTDAEFPTDGAADIEFTLRKENYDANGALSDTESFPLLPYGTTSVSERLFLTSQFVSPTAKDVGALRFYPDFSSTVKVYSGSVELGLGSGFFISVDGGTTWESTQSVVGVPGTPKTCLIRIANPSSLGIFRVEYTPAVSGSGAGEEMWMNADRTVRMDRFQTFVFSRERSYGPITSCRMGLQILMRSNELNTRTSPYLREIVLLGDV